MKMGSAQVPAAVATPHLLAGGFHRYVLLGEHGVLVLPEALHFLRGRPRGKG